MATHHRPNPHANKKKISISYIIREEEERCHRAGVNSLQFDPIKNRLYSAGRDSVIRVWDLSPCKNSPNHRQHNGCSSNNKTTNFSENYYSHSLEHHTDWVNDIVLCCDGRNLISVSNDTTIKVWNTVLDFCMSTLRSHKDYAKCLAHANERELVASAGFDRTIYLWDVHALTLLSTSKSTIATKSLDGSKSSIYSLAINQSGSLIASGSTEKVIRLWDPRSRQKLLKLRGHTDNVRSLLFSKDGSSLLSASSDGTVRLWSIPQQRCISIIRIHDEGVWTLQVNEAFNTVYSGGKDGKIYMTDLKDNSKSSLVCRENAPILKILLVDKSKSDSQTNDCDDDVSLWVSTTDSTIKNWPIKSKMEHQLEEANHRVLTKDSLAEIPISSPPNVIIPGNPAVINYCILNDKRHILTIESDYSVALYDVLTASKVETLYSASDPLKAKANYDEELKKRHRMIYVPNWFSVDLKIGLLCIHLDESECFAAWVSARDYGIALQSEAQDPKVNLGCLMLQALLEYWPETFDRLDNDLKRVTNYTRPNSTDFDDRQGILSPHPNQLISQLKNLSLDRTKSPPQMRGNQYFSIPSHTPIIIGEGNQTILRFLAYDALNEGDDFLLSDYIPAWVSEAVIFRRQPKFTKIPFFLLPHADSGIKSLRKERLSASDMLQMRRVIEHVCEKMIVNVIEENGSMGSDHVGNLKNSSGGAQIFPFDRVELYCNNQKLDENLDLRTVKHFIWKSGGDIILHYIPLYKSIP